MNLRLTSAKKARNQEKRDGRTLTLAFKGGEKTTSVPEGIPIVTLRRSHRDLKPARPYSFRPSGTHAARSALAFVVVRTNGVAPPMEVAPCQIDHGLRPAPRKRKAMTVTPYLSCFLKAFEMALRARFDDGLVLPASKASSAAFWPSSRVISR